MQRKLHKSFLRFLAVGAVGFVIDTSLTVALTNLSGLPAPAARAPAFVTAAFATYLLNRGWTFSVRGRENFWAGWARYLGATSLGAAFNYLVFIAVVGVLGSGSPAIILGITAGSAIGLAFNFAASILVFRPKA